MSELTKIIAENLIRFRKAKGLTQGDLASRVGITRATINRYESGKAGIEIATLEKLSKELDINEIQLISTSKDQGKVLQIASEAAETALAKFVALGKDALSPLDREIIELLPYVPEDIKRGLVHVWKRYKTPAERKSVKKTSG